VSTPVKWNNPDGTRKPCTVEGCSKPIQSRGWCSAHYTKVLRFGDPEGSSPKRLCPVFDCNRPVAGGSLICGRCRQFGWRYGLTPERTKWFLSPENRHCFNPGCSATENLHMDHDHSCPCQGSFKASTRISCGECVRGWLCRSCNLAEGYLNADRERILGLLKYLDLYA